MSEITQLPILGPGISGKSRAVSAQKRQNLYLEIRQEKDKSNIAAYGTPGLKPFTSVGANPCRGMWWFQAVDRLYVVAYNQLIEIYPDGTQFVRGTITTTTGIVGMADNGFQLIIVDGADGYIYTPVTPALSYNFPATTSLTYSNTGSITTFTEQASWVSVGRKVGDSVTISNTTGGLASGTYFIQSVSGATWTISQLNLTNFSGTATVTNKRVVQVTETMTSRATGQIVSIIGDNNIPSGDYTVTVPETAATALIIGNYYIIKSIGTTNFIPVGASLNQVGVMFAATGTATGTGTVSDANDWIFPTTSTSHGTGTLKVQHNFRDIKSAYAGTSFPQASTVAFIDSYFVVNVINSKQFWLSGQYDGFTWDPLQFASKEAYTDDLQAVTVDNGALTLLGAISQEYWQDTGGYPFPFQRIAGTPTDTGLVAVRSLARCAGELFYLGRSRRGGVSVFRVQNYQPMPISPPDLDYLFLQYSNPDDAVAWSARIGGHEFYVLNFQKQAKTWLYDATSDIWSELTSGSDTRHYGQLGTQYNNQIVVSDYRNGNLYTWSTDTYTDNGDTIIRELITPHTFSSTSFNKLHIYRLRLDMEQGTGLLTAAESTVIPISLGTETGANLVTETGSNITGATTSGTTPVIAPAQVMLQISRDGGFTYGDELWTNFGAIGEYTHRAEWRRLGVSRNYVFKFRISDAVKVVLISASAYATEAQK